MLRGHLQTDFGMLNVIMTLSFDSFPHTARLVATAAASPLLLQPCRGVRVCRLIVI